MARSPIRLVVFDIAGTTVRDNNEVLHCFTDACRQEGIQAAPARLNALMGVSKLEVFNTLWSEQLGPGTAPEVLAQRADHSFRLFRSILEDYYLSHVVEPTEGALEAFDWLRDHDIPIALNTGFYRSVTDIILDKLGWLEGLDANYVGGPNSMIQFSITSEEVQQGRPAPYMIEKAMSVLGVRDPEQVVKVGDTPVDLAEGRNAGCGLNLAVTNGSHSRAELERLDNDGLLESLLELPGMLRPWL